MGESTRDPIPAAAAPASAPRAVLPRLTVDLRFVFFLREIGADGHGKSRGLEPVVIGDVIAICASVRWPER